MPTYEYLCQDCGRPSEIRSSVSEYSKGLKPKCPACGSQKAMQTFTTVTVLTGNTPNIVRWLIQHGDQGCCVTDIHKEIGGAHSTLSHHLEILTRYGLVNSRKKGLWIFYSVNFTVFKELFNFLWRDCCCRNSALVEIKTVD